MIIEYTLDLTDKLCSALIYSFWGEIPFLGYLDNRATLYWLETCKIVEGTLKSWRNYYKSSGRLLKGHFSALKLPVQGKILFCPYSTVYGTRIWLKRRPWSSWNWALRKYAFLSLDRYACVSSLACAMSGKTCFCQLIPTVFAGAKTTCCRTAKPRDQGCR